MVAQQCVFFVSNDLASDHAELLAQQTNLLRFRVPASLKASFLRRLTIMNITANSLFPGIDGLGLAMSEMAALESKYFSEV